MGCICNELAGKDIALAATCIGHLWMFEDLQPPELEALVTAARKRQFKKGKTIFMQGTPGTEMFLIKAGRVKLSKLTEEGNELTLDIRKAGDFLGEQVLNEEFDYPLSAICLEDSLACGFSRQGFEKLVLDHPNIGLQVIKNLSRRIDWLTSRAETMTTSNLEERLYRVLSTVAREHGVKRKQETLIQFPLTHEELSFLVGAHRVSITRAMKSLKESGRVVQQGKTLKLVAD
jgi:CRP/FNR family cyclic AMP-dependent transcriptional regulator